MSLIASIRSGAKTVIDSVPGIAQTYSSRPASIGSLPCAFVDEIRSSITHSSGVRTWDGAEVDIYVIAGGFDNEEAQGIADALVGAVVDAFTDTPYFAGANSVGEPLRVRSSSVDNGTGVTYPAWVITVGRIYYAEGR